MAAQAGVSEPTIKRAKQQTREVLDEGVDEAWPLRPWNPELSTIPEVIHRQTGTMPVLN